MKKILFLAQYPNEQNAKDGMVSRIASIDAQFKNFERTYLAVVIKQKTSVYTDGNVNVYYLNLFTNPFRIIKLIFQAEYIYCHSLLSIRWVWLFVIFRKLNCFILDIHGVVPEETKYYNRNLILSLYYNFIEKIVFHKINYAVCVTHSMKKHYIEKYPKAKCKYVIFSIMPSELKEVKQVINQWLNESSEVEIIYSGNTQGWQNIEMMMKIISKNLFPNVHYTILTNKVSTIKEKASFYNISKDKLLITSCAPSELRYYYQKAHYAFILRGDNVVNKVANPTKLVEYLYYGMTPIVLSPHIGDFLEYDYEYINVESFDASLLKPHKSIKNAEIANSLLSRNKTEDLCHKLLN